MLQRCELVVIATAPRVRIVPGGPLTGHQSAPAGRTDNIDKEISSGLSVNCTVLSAGCILGHSVKIFVPKDIFNGPPFFRLALRRRFLTLFQISPYLIGKITHLLRSHQSSVHSSSKFRGWDSFGIAHFSDNSICLRLFIHRGVMPTPSLCFPEIAVSPAPRSLRPRPPYLPRRLFHGGGGLVGCAARAPPPSSSRRPRTFSSPRQPLSFR